MVRSVDRAAAEAMFEPTVTPMVAFPVPPLGATAAHEAPLDAVHEQFAPLVEIETRPAPPAGPYGLPSPDVSIVTLQGRASWVTWKACPPITREPERAKVVELGSTE